MWVQVLSQGGNSGVMPVQNFFDPSISVCSNIFLLKHIIKQKSFHSKHVFYPLKPKNLDTRLCGLRQNEKLLSKGSMQLIPRKKTFKLMFWLALAVQIEKL